MRSISILILCSLFAQTPAEDAAANQSNDTVASLKKMLKDKIMDKLMNKLTDRLSDGQIDHADLDGSTLAKTSPSTSRGGPINLVASRVRPNLAGVSSGSAFSKIPQVRAVQEELKTHGMAPSPLQEKALTAIWKYQQHPMCNRDVRAAALENDQEAFLKELTTKEKLEKAGDEIIPKDPLNMAGVSYPLGYWDPMRFATIFPDGGALVFFREAELKHGRICMLAFLGIFVGEAYHPFFDSGNVDMPAANVREMFLDTPEFNSIWLIALATLGGVEVNSLRTQYDEPFWEFTEPNKANPQMWDVPSPEMGQNQMSTQLIKKDRMPGDIGFDPLNLKKGKSPEEMKVMQTKEINNGRLAMLAVVGILMQELVQGQKTFGPDGILAR